MPEKHILHIEDNFHNRRIVRKILEKQGYKLHEAADGVIGYNMIQEMKPPMVLLDISLPGMDGIEIAQNVKGDDDLKHIILIAVTASAMQGDRERFLAAGCDDYLSKPFRSIDLLNLVNQYYAQIPESYMSSFKPKDVIHPIEEHSVLAEPESWTRFSQTHEEAPEPFAPVSEETLSEPERGFFAREDKAPQTEEPSDEPIESLRDSDLIKTASLEGIFSSEELDEFMEDKSPLEEEVEEVEESPEPTPAMTFAGEAESAEEDDDETVTWVMPRDAVETPPVEEKYPMEELTSDTVESLKDASVTKTTFPQEVSSEEAPDETLMEEAPEPATAEESEAPMAEMPPEGVEMQAEIGEEDESDEIIQPWRAPDETSELALDTDFLEPSVLEETLEEDKEETTPTIASPTEVVEKLMSFSGEETAAETETDLLEEEQATPDFSLEEMATAFPESEDVPTAEAAPETEEEVLTEPAASMDDEIETIRIDASEEWDSEKEIEVEDVLTAEPAPETEEEVSPEPVAFQDKMATTALEAEGVLAAEPLLETEEEILTEPAASLDDEIETIRIDASEEWDSEKEIETEEEESPEPVAFQDKMATTALEAEGVLAAEPLPEAKEEATLEPAAFLDELAAADLEAEDALAAEPVPETEEEVLTEPAPSLDDEIETIRIDASEEWDSEKEIEAEEVEALQETVARSKLDDTSPLKEQVLEASMAEEPRSESPSNGSGREGRSEKKESPKKNELTDQVVQMINPDMIRPVDPNVGLEGA